MKIDKKGAKSYGIFILKDEDQNKILTSSIRRGFYYGLRVLSSKNKQLNRCRNQCWLGAKLGKLV
jgi:hypothetical protein